MVLLFPLHKMEHTAIQFLPILFCLISSIIYFWKSSSLLHSWYKWLELHSLYGKWYREFKNISVMQDYYVYIHLQTFIIFSFTNCIVIPPGCGESTVDKMLHLQAQADGNGFESENLTLAQKVHQPSIIIYPIPLYSLQNTIFQKRIRTFQSGRQCNVHLCYVCYVHLYSLKIKKIKKKKIRTFQSGMQSM